jgi:iron-sulfur cluster repair protein YtfE (RIC family)
MKTSKELKTTSEKPNGRQPQTKNKKWKTTYKEIKKMEDDLIKKM